MYVALVVLTPVLNVGLGFPLRLDDAWLVYLVVRLKSRSVFCPQTRSRFLLAALLLSSILSLSLAVASGDSFEFSEANVVFVLLRLCLVVTVVTAYIRSIDDLQHCLASLYFAVCGSFVVSMLQYLRIQPFVELLFSIYSTPELYRKLYIEEAHMNHVYRVVSTIGNPNHAAFFFVLGTAICFGSIVGRWYGNRFLIFRYVSLIGFFFVTTVALASRTGIALMIICAASFGVVLARFSQLGSRSTSRLIFGGVVASVLVTAAYQYIPPEMVPRRVREFIKPVSRHSGRYSELRRSRFTNWEAAVERISERDNWLFGSGPRSDIVIDNDHLQILYAQGLVGIGIVSIAWLRPWGMLGPLGVFGAKHVVATVFTLFVAMFFFSFTAPVVFAPKIGPIFAAFLGMLDILAMEGGRRLSQPAMYREVHA